jgi:hypothetical protein
MRFFETLAIAALAGSAAASPATVVRNGVQVRTTKKECLCQEDVDLVVSHYKDILTLWKPEYKDWLADEGFYDRSESINSIAGIPYGVRIFPNKTAFVGYQTTTPDLIPLKVDKVGPYNCKEIAFIWSANFTKIPNGTPNPVRGITILDTVKKSGKWLIQSIEVEFNSINYIKNIGGTVTPPPPRP